MPSSKRKPAAGRNTPKLTAAHNFLPLLTKPAEVVVGEYIAMRGKEWQDCPPVRTCNPLKLVSSPDI